MFFSSILITNIAFAQTVSEELTRTTQQSHASSWIESAIVLILGTAYALYGRSQFKNFGIRQHLNAAPGIFTSLGILFTFFSICYSLWNIDSQSFEITTIINDLVPAFTTSIAGIMGAMGVTIYNKVVFAKQDAESDKELGTPEENFHKMTESLKKLSILDKIESNFDKTLESQNNVKTSITDKLQILIDTFASQERVNRELNERLTSTISQQSGILEKFVNDFVARMDDIFRNMRDSIQQQMNDFGKRQFNESRVTVENLMSRLSETTEAMLSAQSTATAESLAQTNASLSAISAQISDSLGQLNASNQSQMDSIISAQAEKMQSLLDSVNAQTAQMREAAKAQAESLQQQMQESYNSVSQHNSDSLTQMIELRDAYAEISTQLMEKAQANNSELTASINNHMQSIVSQMEAKVEDVCKELSDTVRTYLDSLQENYSFMNEQAASIKSNYEQAALSFTDAVENAHNSNRSQENLLEEVNKGLANLSETNSNIAKLLSTIENRQENLDRLVQKIKEVSVAIEAMQELESTLQRVIVK